MKLLTIDTSSSCCGVALTDGEQLIGEYLLAGGKAVSSRLFDAVERLMSDSGVAIADLDGFGVATGPGAFTGLRVGIAAVKGLAMATGKPVAGFSSLAMLAMNLPLARLPVCALYDARKNELYAGLYSCNAGLPIPLRPDEVISPEELAGWITGPTILVGDGAVRYREQLTAMLGGLAIFAPPNAQLPRAANGAMIAHAALQRGDCVSPVDLLPVYLRLSEAELAKQRQDTA
ncbi:tRNA threonylcarbamoyladenosine biosynthesis protein TsaB [Geobacter sp. OR-1]|uniref:tRNA (adenosine(37)-N6)-threonylcarbamoyltransferase complex dimerization subunit type 1 TsaB n=1 Tax=Geobacter sp. OR-1 TaxID=1266765 RepID=UPI0005435385|nr:tRNA (adenosine(37)-N6)-threonylcarbamoyltransferase complex dimerization subunit type 1 TsaB [Geobacter sp. OR-1]GAM11401.1 tRNA threonylcarbamoyladenosine biosynthesis protein TsaB [Geobacter sp. OR-1]